VSFASGHCRLGARKSEWAEQCVLRVSSLIEIGISSDGKFDEMHVRRWVRWAGERRAERSEWQLEPCGDAKNATVGGSTSGLFAAALLRRIGCWQVDLRAIPLCLPLGSALSFFRSGLLDGLPDFERSGRHFDIAYVKRVKRVDNRVNDDGRCWRRSALAARFDAERVGRG
jgi:hypothetical protein